MDEALNTKLGTETEQARRFRWMLNNPTSARHLLHLLSEKKGNSDSFCTMVDRIMACEDADRHYSATRRTA